MRHWSLGLQPEAMYSASCSNRSIGPPPDWGIDIWGASHFIAVKVDRPAVLCALSQGAEGRKFCDLCALIQMTG